MNFTRREWMEKLSIAAVASGTLAARADSSDGDSAYAAFNSRIKKIPPSLTDVPSATVDTAGNVIQPARKLPIFQRVDVAVVGGGAAGWAAALAAARTGAKVALVERDSSLGGLWTNGGVLVLLGTGVRENNRFKLVTRGLCEELIHRLDALGDQAITKRPKNPDTCYQPTANPEAVKRVMDQMLLEAKVDLFFHCFGVDVIQVEDTVKGIVFESKEGRQAILATEVVDASGDGDVFFQAGASYQQILHGMGFVYRMGNMDRIGQNTMGSHEPVPAARWVNNLGPQGNGLDVRALSKIEIEHRKNAWETVQKFRQKPGCSDAFLMQTCPYVGVRATRILAGAEQVSKATAAANTRFNDVVAVSGHDGYRLPEFQIPYGALLPQKVERVLAAGRCISCTPDIIDRVRLIAVCLVTGHAAGVAAALAAQANIAPRALPVADLQKVLRAQGAYLG